MRATSPILAAALRPISTGKLPAARVLLRRMAGTAVTAGLVVFHLVLLRQRLSDLTLLEPVVLARWVASLGLLAALFRLYRSGAPLLRGRKALVLWLLVALLHAVAAVPAVAAPPLSQGIEPASGLLLAAPMLLAASLLGGALARPFGGAATVAQPALPALGRYAASPPSRPLRGALSSPFAPRPPPA